MTARKAFQFLLLTEECLEKRATCNHSCKSCPCFCEQKELEESLYFLKGILKARDPMLYFEEEIKKLGATSHDC